MALMWRNTDQEQAPLWVWRDLYGGDDTVSVAFEELEAENEQLRDAIRRHRRSVMEAGGIRVHPDDATRADQLRRANVDLWEMLGHRHA